MTKNASQILHSPGMEAKVKKGREVYIVTNAQGKKVGETRSFAEGMAILNKLTKRGRRNASR